MLKRRWQQQIDSAALLGGAELWSPFPMAGNEFGMPWLCLTLSVLSWDSSGSSQALNLNLSKIPGSFHSSGCEELCWELLTLQGLDALSTLAPVLHPGPNPAPSPCKHVEDAPYSGSR